MRNGDRLFIFVSIFGCVSGPVSKPATVDSREKSIMIDSEKKVIDINDGLLKAAFRGQTVELRDLLESEEEHIGCNNERLPDSPAVGLC